MKGLVVLQLTLLCCLCNAQISDDQAIFEARKYVSMLAGEVLDKKPVVFREKLQGTAPGIEYLMVAFGEVTVVLRGDGKLQAFSDLRKASLQPKSGAPEKYESHEAAWRAFEDVLARLELNLPEGLERHRIERVFHEGRHCVDRFTMRVRPYGYETLSSRKVQGEVQRFTGRVLSLIITYPGWTYEPPNVQVSESEAIAKAVLTMGGAPSEWRVELRYGTANYDRAPEYFKQLISQQVMRLLYRLEKYDAESRGSAIVIVDSITGAILSSQTLYIDSPSPVEAKKATAKIEKSAPTAAVGTKAARGKTKSSPSAPSPSSSTVALLAAGTIALVGGSWFLLRRGSATHRHP